jgi:hypothetical protein
MMYLRHALRGFLLLAVMIALAVPLSGSPDNAKSDDAAGQSDRSDDQSNDQVTPADFIFEPAAVVQDQFPREISFELVLTNPESYPSPQSSPQVSFVSHLFISGGGLMPRAPA